MRDEELQKIHIEMSSRRNVSSIKNSCNKKFNCKPPNDDTKNNFPDLDDRSSPPIEQLSKEEAKW